MFGKKLIVHLLIQIANRDLKEFATGFGAQF